MITKTQAWGNLADIETHNEEQNTPRLIYNRLLAGQRGSPGWASTPALHRGVKQLEDPSHQPVADDDTRVCTEARGHAGRLRTKSGARSSTSSCPRPANSPHHP